MEKRSYFGNFYSAPRAFVGQVYYNLQLKFIHPKKCIMSHINRIGILVFKKLTCAIVNTGHRTETICNRSPKRSKTNDNQFKKTHKDIIKKYT